MSDFELIVELINISNSRFIKNYQLLLLIPKLLKQRSVKLYSFQIKIKSPEITFYCDGNHELKSTFHKKK